MNHSFPLVRASTSSTSSCNAWKCFFPSNKKEFGIRMCLNVFGFIIASCFMIYNHACGLYNLWTVVMWFISIIEIILLTIFYFQIQESHSRCVSYTQECNNQLFNVVIMCLTFQTLYFTMSHSCHAVHKNVKYFLVAALIFRIVQIYLLSFVV